MRTKNLLRVAMAAILSMFALCTLGGVQHVKADSTDKTLVVDGSADEVSGSTYQTIQAAIDYIYALDTSEDATAKENWTITVNSGTYDQFAVLPGLDGMTVQAADGAAVTVNTWTGVDNASARALYPSGAEFKDSFNSILIIANDVTIDGLNIYVGNQGVSSDGSSVGSATWYASGISDLGTNYIPKYRAEYDNVTVKNCNFTTAGGYSGVLYGGKNNWTVENCTFDGFSIAIYMLGDGYVGENVVIDGNTFTNCEQAVYCYYGGTPEEGANYSTTFSNNTLYGSASQYCMVTFVDLYGNNGSMENLSITGNTLYHSLIGFVDVDGENIDVFGSNTLDACSFYIWSETEGATDSETHSSAGMDFEFHYVSQGDGYWEVSEADLYSINSLLNDKAVVYNSINSEIESTNSSEDPTALAVTVTLTNYAKTFLEPNCIYWVPTIDVTVSKVWNDEDNNDGIRPESAEITLLKNGEATEQTVTLSEANKWTYTFEKLVVCEHSDASSTTNTYSVAETLVPDGYTCDITGNENDGYVVTNSHSKELVSFSITKVWDDSGNQDGIRPSSVSGFLTIDGITANPYTFSLSEDGNWTCNVSTYKYENGEEIDFGVYEIPVSGYTTTVSGSIEEGFTITNTHTPETTTEEPEETPEDTTETEQSDDTEETTEEAETVETTTDPVTTTSAETGDSAPLVPLMILVLLCGAAALIVKKESTKA